MADVSSIEMLLGGLNTRVKDLEKKKGVLEHDLESIAAQKSVAQKELEGLLLAIEDAKSGIKELTQQRLDIEAASAEEVEEKKAELKGEEERIDAKKEENEATAKDFESREASMERMKEEALRVESENLLERAEIISAKQRNETEREALTFMRDALDKKDVLLQDRESNVASREKDLAGMRNSAENTIERAHEATAAIRNDRDRMSAELQDLAIVKENIAKDRKILENFYARFSEAKDFLSTFTQKLEAKKELEKNEKDLIMDSLNKFVVTLSIPFEG